MLILLKRLFQVQYKWSWILSIYTPHWKRKLIACIIFTGSRLTIGILQITWHALLYYITPYSYLYMNIKNKIRNNQIIFNIVFSKANPQKYTTSVWIGTNKLSRFKTVQEKRKYSMIFRFDFPNNSLYTFVSHNISILYGTQNGYVINIWLSCFETTHNTNFAYWTTQLQLVIINKS